LKSVSVIKSISIGLLVFLAFFQFAIIISGNYSEFPGLFGAFLKHDNTYINKSNLPFEYIMIESIRISDGANNFWDLNHKSDEYIQLHLVANEVLKHCYTDDLQYISKNVWDDLLSKRYIMIQYFCDIPLTFLNVFNGDPKDRNGLEKIRKLIIMPGETEINIYVFDGTGYYKLLYTPAQDYLIHGINFDNIFYFVRYSNFYDEKTYQLLDSNIISNFVTGRKEVKVYANPVQKNVLHIPVIPVDIMNIANTVNTYDLKDLKESFLDVTKDRYTLSLGTNNTVYLSNLENQYTITSAGRITYDYFGKKNRFERGDIDLAYNKAVGMLNKFLNLTDKRSNSFVTLTYIDYSNPNHYVFYFDYILDSRDLVLIKNDLNKAELQHAFEITANELNVINANGLLRNIYKDKDGVADFMTNDTQRLILENLSLFSNKIITDIYNGYVISQNAYLSPSLLLFCDNYLYGIGLPAFNPMNLYNEDGYYGLE